MTRKFSIAFVAIFMTAPAFAATDAELKEMMATFLNLDGHLCAKAVEIRPLKLDDQYEVTCVEYRGGSGKVRYIFNAKTGKGFKAN
ncbi:MAG: hypothetical protein R3D82_16080 [Xanthobacteraceae bacterium]